MSGRTIVLPSKCKFWVYEWSVRGMRDTASMGFSFHYYHESQIGGEPGWKSGSACQHIYGPGLVVSWAELHCGIHSWMYMRA